ncbi:MAG: hypothetical protein WCI06_03385 [Methylococcaceae bacterium]
MTTYTALFPLGRTLSTPAAREELNELNYSPLDLLRRHMSGDWGDLDIDDLDANDAALINGSRIFSAYIIEGVKFWVITEADRSSTTILLPSEY